uniref:Sex-determining region Y protein n=1 Tax=Clytia hemisphaerica TaxID=252671 RepID=A0A069DN94_9CNID
MKRVRSKNLSVTNKARSMEHTPQDMQELNEEMLSYSMEHAPHSPSGHRHRHGSTSMTMQSGFSDESGVDKSDKIKRPMNAFMLWSKLRRREISKNDPTIHNAQISKLLGEEWKVLSTEDKQPFLRESQKLMAKHKKEHPNYRYKPRKNKQERGHTSGGGSYHQKAFSLPSQTKPYMKYSSHHHHYRPSQSRSMVDDRRPPSPPTHHPVVYYQYRKCHVPGCYDCEYQRAYESHGPSPPSFCCRGSGYEKSNTHASRRCMCCSPPPYHQPACMGCNRQSSPPPSSNQQRNNSFTVESLINDRGYNSSGKSTCTSSCSNGSTSPSTSLRSSAENDTKGSDGSGPEES